MPLTQYQAHAQGLFGPCKHKENCGNPSLSCDNDVSEPLCLRHLQARGLADWPYIQ